MKGAVCIGMEGPKELNPSIGEEKAILGEICLEERSGCAKL